MSFVGYSTQMPFCKPACNAFSQLINNSIAFIEVIFSKINSSKSSIFNKKYVNNELNHLIWSLGFHINLTNF